MSDQPAPAPSPEAVAEAVHAEAGLDLRPPVTAERVGGGYSWRTYVVADAIGRRVVARVAPPGGTMSPYDPRVEARAIRAAGAAVPAPEVLAVVETPNRLAAPYGVHAFAPGTVRRLSAVAEDDRARHRTAFAATLGALHRSGDASAFDAEAASGTTTDALRRDLVATVAAFARGAPCRHPGFVVGIRWLLGHLPEVGEPPVLCHGDFRFHNLAWEDGAVRAVLDWERAWVGDPMVDVAFTRRFSGWCAVDGEAIAAYAAAAGREVDEDRVAYGDRYEWVRSYTSAARGWQALAAGREDALDLYAIGEAGWVGAWSLVDLLADGPLPPAPDDGLDPWPHPALDDARMARLATLAAERGDDGLAAHLSAAAHQDARATAASVAELRAVAPTTPKAAQLRAALDDPDDHVAWSRAHAVLAEAVMRGGPELIAPLHALARRWTDRTTLLPTARRRP